MLLDIFIPYWGEPAMMRETVRSVLGQDSDAWRLTIVDDAYPDDEIQRWIAGLGHPRVTYRRKDANEGITANYRTCVGLASEPLMMMLGCDDRLLPSYVRQVLAAHARFPQAAIIQPGVEVIDEHGDVVSTLADLVKRQLTRSRGAGYRLLGGEALATNLMLGDWLYWPALTFRTDRIKAFDFREGYPIIQDLALVMDMIFAGEQLLLAPGVAFQYRRHSASASSSKLLDGSRFAGERDYFALAASQAAEIGWWRAERAARWRLTSRAHAGVLLPKALLRRDAAAVRALARHVFGA